MFTKWIDLYRGNDRRGYEELCSLLVRYDVPHRKQVAQPDSKIAVLSTVASRYGSYNLEKELTRTEQSQKLYVLRVKKQDLQKLRKSEDAALLEERSE